MDTLIGRPRELALLRQLARDALEGRGALVVVSGEAGIGKTALVADALAGTALLQHGAAASPLGAAPLEPLKALLRSLRRGAPEAFTAGAPRLAGLLAGDATAKSSTELYEEVAEGLGAIARARPLALILDDLQWADHATLDLLSRVTEHVRSAPLLVAAIHRSEALPHGHPLRLLKERLLRERLLHEISLEPLARADTLRLIEMRLGREPHGELAAAICDRSGGVPLYVEAIVAALRSRKCFYGSGSASTVLPLPDSVREAILAQVDALAPAARRAVEAAALAGSEHALELVAVVNGDEEGIEGLLASGIVVERSPGIASFRTPLARDAVYAAIPWTRRRSLHRRAAEALEARHDDSGQSAHHWQAAGEPARARSALLHAAERAARLHAHRDTVQLLRRALDAWTAGQDEHERLAALDRLGDAARLCGQFAEALRAWRELWDAASVAGDFGAAARALRKIANLHELNCEWARALDARQDAAKAFAASGQRAEAAIEAITIAVRLRMSARYEMGLNVLERAVADAQASARSDLVLRAAALQGNLETRLGRVAHGIATIRTALDAALALDDPAIAGEIYQRLADAIERSSDYGSSLAVNREGATFCEGHTLRKGMVGCLACMGWVLVRSGEWDQATATARRILELAGSVPTARGAALGFLGIVSALRGELRKAGPLLAESDTLARQSDHALAEMTARWGLAVCDALAGHAAAAAERCRAILVRLRQIDERHTVIPVARWSATCLALQGDREGLQACVELLGKASEMFAFPEPLSALAHSLGEQALWEGDAGRAADQFEHAIALIEDSQLPRERVESHLRASVACEAAGRREHAVRHAREAARGAEKLGSRPLLQQATERLRCLGEPIAGALGPRGARRAAHGGLTARQLQILGQISHGLTDKEIAKSLRLSPRTIEMHVARSLAALDCRSRAEAVRKATELGVLVDTSARRR